jgi:hypothetical protein
MLASKLFELAGYSAISAISTFKIKLKGKNNKYEREKIDSPCMIEKRKKIFLSCFVNNFRVPVLLDSGSDVCVIQISLLKRLFKGGVSQIFRSSEGELTSFSSHTIKIKGEVDLNLSFSSPNTIFVNRFYVIDDIPDIPNFLIGDDFLRKYKGIVSYFSSDSIPNVIFMHPE